MLDHAFSDREFMRWLSRTDTIGLQQLLTFSAQMTLPEQIVRDAAQTDLTIMGRHLLTGHVTSASLLCEYAQRRSELSFADESRRFELLCLVGQGTDKADWMRRHVLSKQLAMLKDLHRAKVFHCTASAAVGAELRAHGWRLGEPSFELILEREAKGLTFDPAAQFYFAP